MKRVLIVTPRWIPFASPEMQRVRQSLDFYRTHGWEPILLCVDPTFVTGIQEPELASTIPGDLVVYRCRALPQEWTQRIGIGSLGLRSARHLWRTGTGVLEREKIDLIFLSTTEFVAVAVARLWKQSTGIPYVVDLQDPWRTSHYEEPGAIAPPGGWKYRFARTIAWLLEEWSFSRAGGIMSVSPVYLENLRARYPWMKSTHVSVIPFGASDRDWKHVLATPGNPATTFERKPGRVHLVYTGAAGPILPGAVDTLFAALARFQKEAPTDAAKLRLHFIGTRYVVPGADRPMILPIAKKWGVDSLVEEVCHRVPHFDSLRAQNRSDALLLLGSSDPAYSPSKLYSYYQSQKPILALVYRGSHLEDLLQPLRCAELAFVSSEPLDDETFGTIAGFFRQALDRFPTHSVQQRNDDAFLAAFSPQVLTAQQCALFDRVLSDRQRLPSPASS